MSAPDGIFVRRRRRLLRCLVLPLMLPTVGLSQGMAASLRPAAQDAPFLLARGGGGFGGGRGGGFSGGGGRSGFRDSGGAGGFNRGASRPTGGWSNRFPGDGSPGLSRPSSRPSNLNGSGFAGGDRPAMGGGSRDWGSAGQGFRQGTPNDRFTNGFTNGSRPAPGSWNGTNRFNNSIGTNWNRSLNINNVNLSPGWARPGWGYARPWGFGWYGGWASPPWGWWGASAALWGISGLATAAAINAAVDAAVASSTTYVVVPDTSYQLLFGTVQPVGSQGVSFLVQADGGTYSLTADCNLGTINGVPPTSADQAQLLNAACQVAYGSV